MTADAGKLIRLDSKSGAVHLQPLFLPRIKSKEREEVTVKAGWFATDTKTGEKSLRTYGRPGVVVVVPAEVANHEFIAAASG